MRKGIAQAYALAAIVIGASVASAQAQSVTLKLGTFTGPQHPVTRIFQDTAAIAAKATDGRVAVQVFDSGTLGTGPGTLDAVQKGSMDLGYYVLTYASLKRLPFLVVGGLPYLYKDGDAYRNAWTKDDFLITRSNQHLVERGYDNVFFAAPFFSGFARIGFRNAEPKEPSDLKGLKIRGTGTYNEVVESYGAVVVTIGTPEVYGALEHGLIDGAIGLGTNWTNWKWMEQAKYLLDVPIAPVGGVLAVNKASWSKISPADQKALQTYIKAVEDGLNDYFLKLDGEEKELISKKMKIYTPTPAEAALWRKPKEQIEKAWVAAVGNKDAQRALDIVNRYNSAP